MDTYYIGTEPYLNDNIYDQFRVILWDNPDDAALTYIGCNILAEITLSVLRGDHDISPDIPRDEAIRMIPPSEFPTDKQLKAVLVELVIAYIRASRTTVFYRGDKKATR